MGLGRAPLRAAALITLATVTAWATAASPEGEFRAFAEQMEDRHGISSERVLAWLDDSERQDDIIEAISRPAEGLPWHRYRPIFVKEPRIRQGVEFWREHEALIDRAAETYGIRRSILVAIVGVETRYGGYIGKHRVIDSLRTLAFDYPPRSRFFRGELEEYLLLAREEGFDPLTPVGSYAGAMGVPQFISSSYRAYAVDFNDNGQRDLWEETEDVIGSVANYFARHGWDRGTPIAAPATVKGDRWQALVSDGLKPDTTVGELFTHGVTIPAGMPADTPARLLVLEGEDGDEYWVTFENFYVITRYNHSALYAMAVNQLANRIEAARESSE